LRGILPLEERHRTDLTMIRDMPEKDCRIMNRGRNCWIPLFLLAFVICGCGYHFSPGGEHIDKGIQRVFVEKFVNQTSEANLENYVQSAFINEVRMGSRFELAGSREKTDAILSGKILRSDVSHLSYSNVDVATENRVTVTMEIAFKARGSGEIIWNNNAVTGNESFMVSTDPNRTETNRKNALIKLVGDMAERAYRSIMSGF
jgi:hypothetical protein